MKRGERGNGGVRARERISGRSSAGVASPDLDHSPLLRFEASCWHERERDDFLCAFLFFPTALVCVLFPATAQLSVCTITSVGAVYPPSFSSDLVNL